MKTHSLEDAGVSVLVDEAATKQGGWPCRIVRIDGSLAPDWPSKHSNDIRALLLQHGAILFDGFDVCDVAAFSVFVSKLCPELYSENFEHPHVEGSRTVYWTTPYPSNLPLLSHNENSHLEAWPRLIIFGCIQPAAEGGATLLSDSARMLQMLSPHIVEQFDRRGVQYQRIFGGGLGLDWRVAFKTLDRRTVDAICTRQGTEHAWLDEDRLRLRWCRPALQSHPLSGARVWFNQVTHFHPALLPEGFGDQLRSLFPTDELPRNCAYGDGSPISDKDARAIRQASDLLMFGAPWERGQVLLVDNMRMAHARTPYVGKRRMVVALGEVQSDTTR